MTSNGELEGVRMERIILETQESKEMTG